MFKIYAKIYKGDKIIKSFDYINDEKFSGGSIFTYVSEICFRLDVPVPVILKSHIRHLSEFGHAKFKASDFIEEPNFSRLTLELYT